MQVGFAFLVTGLTRAKNAGAHDDDEHRRVRGRVARVLRGRASRSSSAASRRSRTSAASTPLTGIFGHGSAGVIGLHGFFLQSGGTYDVGVMVLFLFEVVFMETAGYIIIGAIAERISFAGFLLAEIAMGAIIYPIYGKWMWGGGWLAHLGTSLHLGHGAVDFAGSGVVHATGGWAALALAMVLGPRIGKFNKDGTPNAIPGHNIPFVVIGTLVLVFGWMGFNPGSTLGATDLRIGLVAVNTLLAACVGFVMAMGVTNAKYGKPDISMSCNGMLAGLVAITAPCAFVAPWAAVIIGAIAGVLVVYSVEFFDRVRRRRPVRRDLGARHVRRVGRARGRAVRRRHVRRRLERCRLDEHARRARACSTATSASSARRSFHVVVGFIWAWGVTWLIFTIAKNFMQIRVSPEVEIAGPRHAGVRRARLPRLRAAPSTPSVTSRPTPTAIGNGHRDRRSGRTVMKLVTAVVKPFKLDEVKEALTGSASTASRSPRSKGFGRQRGHTEVYRGAEYTVEFVPKVTHRGARRRRRRARRSPTRSQTRPGPARSVTARCGSAGRAPGPHPHRRARSRRALDAVRLRGERGVAASARGGHLVAPGARQRDGAEKTAIRTRKEALFFGAVTRSLRGAVPRGSDHQADPVEVDPADQLVRPKRMRAVPAGSTRVSDGTR